MNDMRISAVRSIALGAAAAVLALGGCMSDPYAVDGDARPHAMLHAPPNAQWPTRTVMDADPRRSAQPSSVQRTPRRDAAESNTNGRTRSDREAARAGDANDHVGGADGDDVSASESDVRDRLKPRSSANAAAPADPGAAALVAEMIEAIAEPEGGITLRNDQPLLIGVTQIQNQSHATVDEFTSFQERFAELLDRAALGKPVSFIASSSASADYELIGTAYIVTAGGFDQWELYFTMQPAREAWTLWQAPRPVRVLRFARAGGPQIFLPDAARALAKP